MYPSLADTIVYLMDSVPKYTDMTILVKAISKLPGIRRIEYFHIWPIEMT